MFNDDLVVPSKEGMRVRRAKRQQFLDGSVKPKISLVIPAKNEERNLPWVIERIPATVDEVILVDGNSTDGTIAITKQLRPDAVILQQKANGKGSALVTGLLAATGDIVVMIDADGSMDPIEIHGLVGALLSGADVVKASRYVAGGGSDDISHLRNAGNQGLRIVSKLLFKHDWSELAYGYAAFWTDILPALHLEPIVESGNPLSKKEYGRGFEIEALLFTRSIKVGLKMSEVFSFEYPRIYGESNLATFKDGWRVLTALFRERFTPIPKHPEKNSSPVLVIGSGDSFLSGISHYTAHLTNELAKQRPAAVILMRNLIPRFLYPGKNRENVSNLSSIEYSKNVAVYNGVDWNRGKSLRNAKRFIRTIHPEHVILQWWTAAVFHNYLALAKTAKRNGAKLTIEFHEVQDVGEAKLPLTQRISRWTVSRLLKMSDSFIVHSSYDKSVILREYPEARELDSRVIPHGPYDDLVSGIEESRELKKSEPLKLMFFGVLREYKGLNVLADAIEQLEKEKYKYSLTIVGEPWEGKAYQHAVELAAKYESVKLVDRYIEDAEIPYLINSHDVLVLPYLRSSASGPVAIAMAAGKPVVTTSIPALLEATNGYSGVVYAEVGNAESLKNAIKESRSLVGQKHDNPLSWDKLVKVYGEIL